MYRTVDTNVQWWAVAFSLRHTILVCPVLVLRNPACRVVIYHSFNHLYCGVSISSMAFHIFTRVFNWPHSCWCHRESLRDYGCVDTSRCLKNSKLCLYLFCQLIILLYSERTRKPNNLVRYVTDPMSTLAKLTQVNKELRKLDTCYRGDT